MPMKGRGFSRLLLDLLDAQDRDLLIRSYMQEVLPGLHAVLPEGGFPLPSGYDQKIFCL